MVFLVGYVSSTQQTTSMFGSNLLNLHILLPPPVCVLLLQAHAPNRSRQAMRKAISKSSSQVPQMWIHSVALHVAFYTTKTGQLYGKKNMEYFMRPYMRL
jgi:hypothetical protein